MYMLEAEGAEVLRLVSEEGEMTAAEISKCLEKDCSKRINVLYNNDLLWPTEGTGAQADYVPMGKSCLYLSPDGELALQDYEARVQAGKRRDSLRFILTIIVASVAAIASIAGTAIVIFTYFSQTP